MKIVIRCLTTVLALGVINPALAQIADTGYTVAKRCP